MLIHYNGLLIVMGF